MKRIAVILVMVLVIGRLALATETTVLKVKVQSANIRTQPDINAAVVKQVKMGTLLESEQMVGDWYEVSVTNDLGVSLTAYIHANVVDVVSGAAEAQPEAQPVVRPAQPTQPAPQTYNQGYAPVKTYPGGFKIMAAYGMASMTYSNDSAASYDKYKKSLMGLGGGLGFESGGMLGVEIDVLYLPKGIRYKGTDSGYDFDIKFRLNEISVPVLLKFNLPVQGINPFLLGGGEIAYVAQAKYDYSYSGGGQSKNGTTDLKNDIVKMDYGLVLGGGLGISLSGINLVAELRYHLGFANLNKKPKTGDPTVKSNMLLLLAGFKF
ncbi:MAG: SH3 domain-containing protein [Candidatus Aminicenantes bacterium]|nr:SH3 domain-containing protein [Candidatus Aminicenantes bacterium]